MIVKCEHCQTKYRIADEKVQGKGVKVRCAKCKNVFTVTPPKNDIQGQSPAPPSSPVPEPPAPEPTPAPAPKPPAPPPSEEPVPDRANGVIEGPPGLPPLPPLGDFHDSPVPEKRQQPAEAVSPDQAPGGSVPPSLEEGPSDLGAQRPAHEIDQTGLTSPPPSTTKLPEKGGFEIEGTTRDEVLPGSDPFGGETADGTAAPPQEPDSGGGWGNIAIDGQDAPDSAGDDLGLAGSSGYEAPPPGPMEEPAEQPLPDHVGDAASETSLVPAYQPETRTSGGGKKRLVILLLLATLGGGGYFAYPTVMEMIQSRGQHTEGILTPANIQVKALSRTDGKIIYAVRGEVRNESASNVGMIQVEAQFRNASGDVLSKATSYCGNLFEDSDLVALDLNQVQSDLQNELGQSLSNSSIAPGQAVPFLVILNNPPSGISKVTVTISSFKETT